MGDGDGVCRDGTLAGDASGCRRPVTKRQSLCFPGETVIVAGNAEPSFARTTPGLKTQKWAASLSMKRHEDRQRRGLRRRRYRDRRGDGDFAMGAGKKRLERFTRIFKESLRIGKNFFV